MGIDIHVDKAVCARSGFCEAAVPDVFLLRDGEDHVHLITTHVDGEEAEELVRDAVAACPTRAISIRESQ